MSDLSDLREIRQHYRVGRGTPGTKAVQDIHYLVRAIDGLLAAQGRVRALAKEGS